MTAFPANPTPDPHSPGAPAAFDRGLTVRSLLLSVGLTVLCGVWVRQAEIVVLSTQISESIPAIPGLAALIFLLGVNGLVRRFTRLRPLSRGELIVIFLFVTIATTVMGVGVQRFLLALITAPFYFERGGIQVLQRHFQPWFAVTDPVLVKQLYEGSPDGRVPWHVWWLPATMWLLFFLALWWTLYCMVALIYRAWSEEERLPFPLVVLPLEMTGATEARSLGAGFFRNPVMWAGFGFAAFYNGVNILYSFNPSFPQFGKDFVLHDFFPEPPWNALRPLTIHFRPEMIGLGYLVSTEISLTVWVTFLLHKLAAVVGVVNGYPAGQLPYAQEQGIGAYLVLAALLLWMARRQLLRALRLAWRGEPGKERPEGISYRTAVLGLVGGFVAVCVFCRMAGMAVWLIAVYLAIVLAVALVYARVRGEAGAPLVWLFPYYMQKNVLLYTFGSSPFAAAQPSSTLTLFATFTFLARGYFPSMIGYQLEGMELVRRARIWPRALVITVVLALIVGWIVGWYQHLVPYYHHGAQQLRGGIWGWHMAVQEYTWANQYTTTPKLPEPPRVAATAVGGGVALALALLRYRFAGFPLHPIGYAMTCSYGTLIWYSFLVVWVLKSLALRYGGMNFYRKSIPFFLGLALGHFAVAGIFWGLIGAWSGDAVRGYPVFFG